ncbi:MAG: hypothetical protein ABI846_13505 [Rudaea sp.]
MTALLASFAGLAHAGEVTPAAQRVAATIDALDVEQHWPAGVHVHWESGKPDGKPELSAGKHTHCSAFVAAAAKQLGIYILRPPEHAQILLANAQYDWLENEGRGQGWNALDDGVAAQAAANRGMLVVATYKNHHDDKPGHIAIVRPSDKSRGAIVAEGPQVTQAGGSNYRSTSLRQGFAGHPAAWKHAEVRYYAHAVAASPR